MDVDALIEAIRKRQVLYDRGDAGYSNRAHIYQHWKDVAEEVGTDEGTARKKWAVLRDSFRKHHKKITNVKSGSGRKFQRKWYLYNRLLFLIPFVEGRNASTTTTNLAEGPNFVGEESKASLLLEEITDNNSHSPGSSSPQTENTTTNVQPQNSTTIVQPQRTFQRTKIRPYPQKRPASMSPFDAEMLSALKGFQQQQQQQNAPLDDDEQFLLSLVPAMKSLDPISKFELRGEINATALRYLQRSQPPSRQHGGQGYYLSRSSTPKFQSSSPLSATTDESCRYSEFVSNRTQTHQVSP